MATYFEPRVIRQWLEPLGLDMRGLLEQTTTYQADLLRFYRPLEGGDVTVEERAGLFVLGWTLADYNLSRKPYRTILGAAFDLFLTIGELATAEYLLEQAYPEKEGQEHYLESLLQLRLAQNRLSEAETVLNQIKEEFPDRFLTQVGEGRFYRETQKPELAIAAYQQALEVSPGSTQALLGLAQAALQQGDEELARQALTQLDEKPTGWWRTLAETARLWRKLGDLAEAERKEQACQESRQRVQARLQQTGGGETAEETAAQDEKLEVLPDLESVPAGAGLNEEARRVLQEVFGHSSFRPGQEQVISQVLAGQDTLAVLPTGAGKSLCYQLPALLLPRPALVLSPLISLMKDQFDKLPPALKSRTLVINSSLEPGEAARRLREVARPGNSVRLIYAAPERLRQRSFVTALERAGLGLLVVDESHCVAMWGNDFRPDYLFIRRVLADLSVPVLAVTATATPQVADEIGRQLGRELALVRGSVFRKNLNFGVEKVVSAERYERIAELCGKLEGSGIVYTRSRDKCEALAAYLSERGVSAQAYHAGLDTNRRRTTQEEWIAGRYRVIVATIAFGMGIDKPDVRYIIHLSPSASLENYLQEAGRAGRDGENSLCLLLYTSNDKGNLTRWLREERDRLNLEALREIYRVVSRRLAGRRHGVVPLMDLLLAVKSKIAEPDETLLRVGLSLLERAELLERGYDLPANATVSLNAFSPAAGPDLFGETEPHWTAFLEESGVSAEEETGLDLVELADRLGWTVGEVENRLAAWAEAGRLHYDPAQREPYLQLKEAGQDSRARLESLLEQMRVAAEQRLDELEDYLKSRNCRQVLLARHFGEKLAGPCGVCDNCEAGPKPDRKREKTALAENHFEPGSARVALNQSVEQIILGALAAAGQPLSKASLRRMLLDHKEPLPHETRNPYYRALKGRATHKDLTNYLDNLAERSYLSISQSEGAYYGQTYDLYELSEAGRQQLEAGAPIELAETTPAAPVVAKKAATPAPIDQPATIRVVLECLNALTPDGVAKVGRTGLARLLLGQPTALGTRASNPYKGRLEGQLKGREVESLIEQLVKTALIEEQPVQRVMGGTYQALRLSEAGLDWLENN